MFWFMFWHYLLRVVWILSEVNFMDGFVFEAELIEVAF